MLKKLWLIALSSLLVLPAISSADTVDWFTSDGMITKITLNDSDTILLDNSFYWNSYYICVESDDVPFLIFQYNSYYPMGGFWFQVDNNYSCSIDPYYFDVDQDLYIWMVDEDESKYISWKIYLSSSPITYWSSSWGWSSNTPEADVDMMFYDNDWSYQPDEVTFKDNYYLYVDSFTCPSSAWYECSISFYQWSTRKCSIASYPWSSDLEVNTCSYLPAWTYDIYWEWYTSIHIQWYVNELPTTPSDPETPESDNVVWSFWSGLSDLVGNLLSSFSGILPTLILVWFGVLVVFVFWWYVKHVSVELFSMWRNRNKSLSYYQNEDVNAMYNNWRTDFVKKHDVNKIIENDYDYEDVSRRAETYADNELINNDLFYSMSSEERMEVWWKYKMDYINKHFKKK